MKKYLGGLVLAFIMIGCGGDGAGDSNGTGSIVVMQAIATATPTTATQGDSITLNASDSTISSGEIDSWSWSENGARLSQLESFTKNDFTLGGHTVKLIVKDRLNNEASTTVTFNVTAAPTPGKWDNISVLDSNGTNELFVTSDATNIYIRLKKDANVTNAQFFINADNSNLSGAESGMWTEDRFEYVVKDDGVYHLLNKDDYNGVKVQNQGYTITADTIEMTIEKKNLVGLAEKFTVGAWLQDFSIAVPGSATMHEFTDTFYVAKADTLPPEFDVRGANPLILNVGEAFSEPGVSATDVVSGPATVTTDKSAVDTSKSGFYMVRYTASDASGNEANASRIVEVRGGVIPTTLEVKNLGLLSESVVINHQTRLVWANDNTDEPVGGGSTRGCIINDSGATNAQLKSRFEGYCERSDYAGFTDWRVPTALELSKFTVQMAQEKKTPGMARKNCSRTLGIDGDVVSAVWTDKLLFQTHKNYAGYIETSTVVPSGGRCVRGTLDTSTGGFTLQTGELNAAKVVVDTATNLMWVNEFNSANTGCLAIHFDKPAEYTTSKDFCSILNYAGKDDWRDPTPNELSDYVIRTNEAHVFIGFEAPCKKVLARERDADGNITVEKEIYTRYNGSNLGVIADLNITNSNIGLRCVRPNN